jgi:hypothetical protein
MFYGHSMLSSHAWKDKIKENFLFLFLASGFRGFNKLW